MAQPNGLLERSLALPILKTGVQALHIFRSWWDTRGLPKQMALYLCFLPPPQGTPGPIGVPGPAGPKGERVSALWTGSLGSQEGGLH